MVEEDKEAPVNQPGTLLQSYQGIGELLKHNRQWTSYTDNLAEDVNCSH